jgi:hypothetical protein
VLLSEPDSSSESWSDTEHNVSPQSETSVEVLVSSRSSMRVHGWLITMGVRLTPQNRGHHWPIVHPPGECEWRAVVMMMPAGDNSWSVYQSSLAVLSVKTSVASRRNGQRMRILRIQCLWYVNGSFTYLKILRHGASNFTSHPKEGVLRIVIALKNPSPRLGFNPRPLCPLESTLISTPPRRRVMVNC